MTAATYSCIACGRERDFEDVMAVAGPAGAGWYCRDATACWRARGTDDTTRP